MDLKVSNKTHDDPLSIRKHHPIAFDKNNIFIQAKTIVPIGKHDGTYGYINIDSIDRIGKFTMDTSFINLKDGQAVKVLCREETPVKNIKHGEILQRLIKEKDNFLIKESGNLYLEENPLANKGDMAMIYMELIEIKNDL